MDRFTFTVTIDQSNDHPDDRFPTTAEALVYIVNSVEFNASPERKRPERPNITIGGLRFYIDPTSIKVGEV